jgi:protein-tyrosine-phosphatase
VIPRTGPADPRSVLFLCSLNSIRSPMAAALLEHLRGSRVKVRSAGIRGGAVVDGFAVAAMGELGIDIKDHRPLGLAELEDRVFDLVITLSPEAHHGALELTRDQALAVEYWPIQDPTVVDGPREARLDAYRAVRDGLLKRIRARFPAPLVPKF